MSIINIERRAGEGQARSVERGSGGQPKWARTFARRAVLADAVAALLGAQVSRMLRFGWGDEALAGTGFDLPYAVLALLMVPAWIGAMWVHGAYDSREIGNGSE